jgi:hypothetical protein
VSDNGKKFLVGMVMTDCNIAGELVSPKNIMVGSNNPSLVMKAAFHLSPSLIRTLLYPQCILNLVYREHPLSWSISLGIKGSG